MRPIFVGGCGRSGTTFLASLLGGHPAVVAPPEAQFLVAALGAAAQSAPAERDRRFVAALEADWRLGLWRPERPIAEGEPAAVMRRLAAGYAESVRKPGAGFWVDHTPNNVLHARTLLDLFPGSHMIHLVRDPRAVAASVLPLDWGPASPRDAARWWLSRVGAGLAAELGMADRVLRVHYEALVGERCADELGRICAAVGLDFDPAMVAAPSFRRPRYTEAQHALVGRPPDPRRAFAWRESLGADAVATIEAEVGDTLVLLGYEPATPRPAPLRPRGARELVGTVARTAVQRVGAHRRRRVE